jgi:hypothetical protein
MRDGRHFAATRYVALRNGRALVLSPHRIINAHLTTGIFPCRLRVVLSVTTAYYYQATRGHSTEYSKAENSYLCCMDDYRICYLRGDADKSLARPLRKQATATSSGFIQHTPHEDQYTS